MKLNSYDNLIPSEIINGLDLPSHWRKIRFRHLFSFDRGLGITKANLKDEGIPCVNYGEIHSKFGFEVIPERDTLKCVDEDYLETGNKSLLQNGDFVFADTSEDLEGSGNFTYLNSDETTFAGYHTVIARLLSQDLPRYIAYLFDSKIYRNQVIKSVTGVKVFSITQAILKANYLWLPPIKEQKYIVQYLDYKTKKIDVLVQKEEALISALKEERSALITHSVTKGLDKKAKLKLSDFDWLGHTPESWSVKPLRFLGKCQNGINIGGEYFGQGDPFVSYGDVYKNRELPNKVKGLVLSSDTDKKSYSVKSGDVLFTRTSETAEEIGYASVCMKTIENAVFSGFLIRFRPDKNEVCKEYCKYYFQNDLLRAFFAKEMNIVTRASLSQDLLKKLPVLIPSQKEQKEIAQYLDQQTARIDEMISNTLMVISKLNEYRATLISSAVVGKIDLRDINIPEEV